MAEIELEAVGLLCGRNGLACVVLGLADDAAGLTFHPKTFQIVKNSAYVNKKPKPDVLKVMISRSAAQVLLHTATTGPVPMVVSDWWSWHQGVA